MPNSNNSWNSQDPAQVAKGGTGLATITDHGVMVGSGTGAVTPLSVGGTGELLVGEAGADPAFGTSATGDFTFTSATAGATRTFTVSNSDNSNAASTALIVASTGGANAGDPKYQASTTTTTWSFGADNSATVPSVDPFVISQGTALGTNDCMKIGTAGTVNFPLQPAFSAYLSSTQSNVTGDGTQYQIAFDTEFYDVGGNYNTGTGVFTAPVAGIYLFNCNCYAQSLATANGIDLLLFAGGNIYHTGIFTTTLNGNFSTNFSIFVKMAASDTALVKINVTDGTKIVDIYGAAGDPRNLFSGTLIC